MKKLAILISIVLIISIFSGCSKYNEKDFIGKTADEITAKYGEFDINGEPFVTTDSSYRGFGYGYLIRNSYVGFLGTEPAVYFFIVFNSNGIATNCYEGYHCNGG